MKITGKHKLYGVILLAGFTALGIDQLYGTRPGANSIGEATGPDASIPQVVMSAGTSTRNWLKERLSELGADSPPAERDAFSVPAGWSNKPANTSGSAATHRLSAVIVGPSGGAMIDGRYLRVGQSFNGLTLQSVARGKATLVDGDTTLVLGLAD